MRICKAFLSPPRWVPVADNRLSLAAATNTNHEFLTRELLPEETRRVTIPFWNTKISEAAVMSTGGSAGVEHKIEADCHSPGT